VRAGFIKIYGFSWFSGVLPALLVSCPASESVEMRLTNPISYLFVQIMRFGSAKCSCSVGKKNRNDDDDDAKRRERWCEENKSFSGIESAEERKSLHGKIIFSRFLFDFIYCDERLLVRRSSPMLISRLFFFLCVLRAIFITKRMCERSRKPRVEWAAQRILKHSAICPENLPRSRRVHVGKRLLIQFHSFLRDAFHPFCARACTRTESVG
jgi:hypothetical protein